MKRVRPRDVLDLFTRIAIIGIGLSLPVWLYLVLTVLGGLIMSLAVLWGGVPGGAAFGVIYVYLTMFSFIACATTLPRLTTLDAPVKSSLKTPYLSSPVTMEQKTKRNNLLALCVAIRDRSTTEATGFLSSQAGLSVA